MITIIENVMCHAYAERTITNPSRMCWFWAVPCRSSWRTSRRTLWSALWVLRALHSRLTEPPPPPCTAGSSSPVNQHFSVRSHTDSYSSGGSRTVLKGGRGLHVYRGRTTRGFEGYGILKIALNIKMSQNKQT